MPNYIVRHSPKHPTGLESDELFSTEQYEGTAGNKRLALYKNWYMGVTKVHNKFEGHIWKWERTPYIVGKKSISKKKKFNTEEAVKWCENEVEMRIIADGVPYHSGGSGI